MEGDRWKGTKWPQKSGEMTVQVKEYEKNHEATGWKNERETDGEQIDIDTRVGYTETDEGRSKGRRIEKLRREWKPAEHFLITSIVLCFKNKLSQFLILFINRKGINLICEGQILLPPLAPERSVNT